MMWEPEVRDFHNHVAALGRKTTLRDHWTRERQKSREEGYREMRWNVIWNQMIQWQILKQTTFKTNFLHELFKFKKKFCFVFSFLFHIFSLTSIIKISMLSLRNTHIIKIYSWLCLWKLSSTACSIKNLLWC